MFVSQIEQFFLCVKKAIDCKRTALFASYFIALGFQ